jgi:putrescine transport system ATP-binding protein
MVSHVAWMGSYARYQIRLDSGPLVEATVPSLVLAQGAFPALDEEVFISWSNDSATVLPS